MYLTNLDIIGFKSFADKTEFVFNEGITCFVGPNGSGKTNVVDAIRWVLGEQRASILRSEAMENVIFNGTSSRKPLGMAEVSLTIKNNKKILPLEFSEVKITRRLFRDGESQYLLNNTPCRLKDIIDLFMDTGMGAGSYSVIELKMVEAILSGRSEERRYLIEEAAGINKYKTRRKDCTKKLSAVQENLTRFQDILSEVQKNVNSLARQASKTQRYNKLFSELKSNELNLLKIEFNSLQNQIISLKSELEKQNIEKSNLKKNLIEAEAYLAELENKRNQIDENFKQVKEKESKKYSEIAQKTKDIAITQEKINSLNQNITKLKQEINDVIKALNSNNNSLVSNNQKLTEIEEQKSDLLQQLENLKYLEEEARAELYNIEEEYIEKRNELGIIENQINQIQSQAQNSQKHKSSISTKISEINDQIKQSEEQITKISEQIELLEKEEKNIIEKINIQKTEIENAQCKKQQLQEEIAETQSAIINLTQELSQYEAKLEFLNNLVDTTESTKFLLETEDWQINGEKTFLGEIIYCKDEYRIAIESCLGEIAKYFVVENRSDAMKGIFSLTEHNRGKATFVIKDNIPEITPPPNDLLPPNAIGWLSELIECDNKIKNILRIFLENVVLFKDWEDANKSIEQGLCQIAVTLKGEIIDSRGILKGGSTLSSEGEHIAKKQRKIQILAKISDINEKIRNLQDKITKLKNENENININNLNEFAISLEKEKNNIFQKLTHLRYQVENLKNNISLYRENITQLQREQESLDYNEDENKSKIENLTHQRNELKEALNQHNKKLINAKTNYEQYRTEVHEIELKLARLDADYNNTKKEIERLNAQKNSLNAKQNNTNKELEKAQKEIQILKVQLENENKELNSLQSEYNSILGQSAHWNQSLKSISEQVQQHTNILLQLRKQYDKLIDTIHGIDIKINEAQHQIGNIDQRAREFYQTEIDTYQPTERYENIDKQKLAEEIKQLKEKISSLGTINFLALDEYEAQKQRLNFYETQVNDLIESEKQLQTAIVEINRTAEEVFMKTFEEIRKNFKVIFQTLFGKEGDCDLRIIGDDILEGDIEIIAKPPGKRPHSIEVLSGGEKTLTAIAFLFAIYMVKPSPFCFLDEVDAPLDDANIDKFLNLIKKFSENTQFIIATHNKRTMEFANTLYGITMEEDGVSRVISVKLEGEKESINNNLL